MYAPICVHLYQASVTRPDHNRGVVRLVQPRGLHAGLIPSIATAAKGLDSDAAAPLAVAPVVDCRRGGAGGGGVDNGFAVQDP